MSNTPSPHSMQSEQSENSSGAPRTDEAGSPSVPVRVHAQCASDDAATDAAVYLAAVLATSGC